MIALEVVCHAMVRDHVMWGLYQFTTTYKLSPLAKFTLSDLQVITTINKLYTRFNLKICLTFMPVTLCVANSTLAKVPFPSV